ncbi:Rrf2 family transcriptional regulator [Dyadobacter frigoris]|uniref:Rrf2 family transcriptional regulator n=1 Tax=Dyadobacter frigoris TaxID=2576211 RepID=A0A4U6CY66_9BACT|nr:Rrf2 family transcriptional regulator [Dyadobacter frigoris]TKT88795.1 Rrf2 family transcriptional regulator [Dyadobacter frigoris]GLU53992.1 hypothetical protein Dfri01_34530 [Dyadobacter frigoris]
MISRKIKYALKILRLLDRQYMKEPAFVSEIVKKEDISQHYAETILVRFKHGGLIEKRMHHGGGYSLLVPADQINFLKNHVHWHPL